MNFEKLNKLSGIHNSEYVIVNKSTNLLFTSLKVNLTQSYIKFESTFNF